MTVFSVFWILHDSYLHNIVIICYVRNLHFEVQVRLAQQNEATWKFKFKGVWVKEFLCAKYSTPLSIKHDVKSSCWKKRSFQE